MCLQPIRAARTELAISDAYCASMIAITRNQLSVRQHLMTDVIYMKQTCFFYIYVLTVVAMQRQWGALFPTEWREHKRPCSQLQPFRSPSTSLPSLPLIPWWYLYIPLIHSYNRLFLGLPPSSVYEQYLITSLSRWVLISKKPNLSINSHVSLLTCWNF